MGRSSRHCLFGHTFLAWSVLSLQASREAQQAIERAWDSATHRAFGGSEAERLCALSWMIFT